MKPNKFLKIFIHKFPRSYRGISFEILKIINFVSYFIFLPTNILFNLILKYKLSKSRGINKVIIRNDKIGDCALTLPFIYGTLTKKECLYYVSPILDEITAQLNINCNWKSSKSIINNNKLLIANLATSKISNFIKDLPKSKSKIIFTQLSSSPFSKSGFPLIFSPNYLINKSQTRFVNNFFIKLRINSSPTLGIKVLNSHLEKFIEVKNDKKLVIVLGLGIDIGRQLNENIVSKIVYFARQNFLNPIILEEPGFENNIKDLAKKNNIESKSCKNFFELFLFLKSSKFVIGYDCGPTHIASLLTNSIILFSHTPIPHWGKHIWNIETYKEKLKYNNHEVTLIKQLNNGSNKNNWIICGNEKGCSLHKSSCKNNNCSELNELLLLNAIKSILNVKNNNYM